jgi:hypothetical protein
VAIDEGVFRLLRWRGENNQQHERSASEKCHALFYRAVVRFSSTVSQDTRDTAGGHTPVRAAARTPHLKELPDCAHKISV